MVENLKVGDVFWWVGNCRDPKKLKAQDGWDAGTFLGGDQQNARPEDCFATELEAWEEVADRRWKTLKNANQRVMQLKGASKPGASAAFDHATYAKAQTWLKSQNLL